MRYVDAGDAGSADLLEALLALLAESGGWLHPSAVLVERDGEMSIHADADDGEPLVRVPRSMMVRVGRFEWSADDERLVGTAPPDVPGPERESALLLCGLLNQTGKVATLRARHPALSAGLSPGLIDGVRHVRPSFRRRLPDAAGLVWSTRCVRLPMGGEEPEPVAIPIVDLINHRRDGATLVLVEDSVVVPVRSFGGECVLDYGHRRDAIGMAVVYGFADVSAAIAHSAPVTVAVPEVGSVTVVARGRRADGTLNPMAACASATGVAVNRLSFGDAPVDSLEAATGWPRLQCASVVTAVAEANLRVLERIIDEAASCTGSAAADVLVNAARIQAAVITADLV